MIKQRCASHRARLEVAAAPAGRPVGFAADHHAFRSSPVGWGHVAIGAKACRPTTRCRLPLRADVHKEPVS